MHRKLFRRLFLCSMVLTGLLLSLALAGATFVLPRAHAATGDGSPTDPDIKYIGRWDTSSADLATSYWGGAYLKTSFTGTTVSIKLAGSANIYASIDNGGDVYYAGANGTVNLTPTPLLAGTHTLRVAAKSEWDQIQFQGLVLDAGATTVSPTVSPTIIEFVGDSITSGLTDSKSSLSAYGWLAGEQLGVEHTQVAFSGICLVEQCHSSTDVGMSTQFFKEKTVLFSDSPDWDFQRYQASEVVINLGTNDNANTSDANFQSVYTSFLQNIRQKYPNAAILVLQNLLGEWIPQTQAAVQARNDAGDNNVFYIDTSDWITYNSPDYNDGAHPSDAGHAKLAQHLVPVLQSHLPGSGTPTPTPTSTPTATPTSTPTPTPTSTPIVSWTKCADEGGTCTFSGTHQVRYGANGTYNYQTATNSIACNNATFGDPTPGVFKECDVSSSDTSTPTPTPTTTVTATPTATPTPTPTSVATWTKCADEGGACTFSGTHQVRYGANGLYNYQNATGSIACNNATFGDPIVGVYKACYYQ